MSRYKGAKKPKGYVPPKPVAEGANPYAEAAKANSRSGKVRGGSGVPEGWRPKGE